MTDRIPLEEKIHKDVKPLQEIKTCGLGHPEKWYLSIDCISKTQAEQLKSQILQDAEKAQRLDEAIEKYNHRSFDDAETTIGTFRTILQQIRDGVKT